MTQAPCRDTALRILRNALAAVPDDTSDDAYFGLKMRHGEARAIRKAIEESVFSLGEVKDIWQKAVDTGKLLNAGMSVADNAFEALRQSNSYSVGSGPDGEFVTINFRQRGEREAFVDAYIAALTRAHLAAAIGGSR